MQSYEEKATIVKKSAYSIMASKCWLIPEKSKQPAQLLVRIAVKHRGQMQQCAANRDKTPVRNPRAFNDAAAAMTTGTGTAEASVCMTMDAASAP